MESDVFFVTAALFAGLYYRILTARAHSQTFASTATIIESRIKLECEREQQEQLLLSVIPAYIAAEVRVLLFFFIKCYFIYLFYENMNELWLEMTKNFFNWNWHCFELSQLYPDPRIIFIIVKFFHIRLTYNWLLCNDNSSLKNMEKVSPQFYILSNSHEIRLVPDHSISNVQICHLTRGNLASSA